MSEGQALQVEISDGVALLQLDDGKANALSFGLLAALDAAVDTARKESAAIALIGRPGRFCAGFDLGVMRAGDGAEVARLVGTGARFGQKLFEHPRPVVIGCTGHALAMGALLLLCADRRIGARGEFKLGLNEVAIGMALPGFGVELAQTRLSRRHVERAVIHAQTYGPDGAVDAGYLDEVVDAERTAEAAREAAAQLAALDPAAFAATKRSVRRASGERLGAAIEAEFGS